MGTIVDAVFVPPAAEKLSDLLSNFEKFLNNDEINVPNLVKIAIAHYQFETMLVTGDFNHKNTGENRQRTNGAFVDYIVPCFQRYFG